MNEQQGAMRDDLRDDVMDKTGDGKCPADGCGRLIELHERPIPEGWAHAVDGAGALPGQLGAFPSRFTKG